MVELCKQIVTYAKLQIGKKGAKKKKEMTGRSPLRRRRSHGTVEPSKTKKKKKALALFDISY
jgi:hypothetical protein